MNTESKHFRFSNLAIHENIPYFLDMTELCLNQLEVTPKDIFKLLIAVEEMIVNIVTYAYPENTGNIEMEISLVNDSITLIFIDEGIAFNPLKHQVDQRDLPLSERNEGGLGIILTKDFSDNLDYNRINGKNIITFKKKIR